MSRSFNRLILHSCTFEFSNSFGWSCFCFHRSLCRLIFQRSASEFWSLWKCFFRIGVPAWSFNHGLPLFQQISCLPVRHRLRDSSDRGNFVFDCDGSPGLRRISDRSSPGLKCPVHFSRFDSAFSSRYGRLLYLNFGGWLSLTFYFLRPLFSSRLESNRSPAFTFDLVRPFFALCRRGRFGTIPGFAFRL